MAAIAAWLAGPIHLYRVASSSPWGEGKFSAGASPPAEVNSGRVDARSDAGRYPCVSSLRKCMRDMEQLAQSP
jgi:hypothetical protein